MSSDNGDSNPPVANGNGLSGFLEFEKPLQRILQDIEGLEREQREAGRDVTAEIRQQRARYQATLKRLYTGLTPWETVLVARHPKRPLSTDYLRLIFRDFCELHGDRAYADDKAIITGFARIGGHKVMFVGHNKGKDVKERIACHFGCAHPEGYRKALQKMKLAEKYGLPVVCLVDTQGAYPGVGAEERGIAYAIAENLREMARLRTPIVCVVIGEGGSGGALGIGVGDRVAMLQHAFYSVISPEGCAAILWKTAEHRKHAAEALKLTAPDLLKLDLIDDVVPEPLGAAHRDPETTAAGLEAYIVGALGELKKLTTDALVHRRQQRIRHLGSFFEEPAVKVAEVAKEPRRPRRIASRTARLTRIPG
jgi:acetyl-CoA carboxylase carboxyl transferase subunit alpha